MWFAFRLRGLYGLLELPEVHSLHLQDVNNKIAGLLWVKDIQYVDCA